MHSACFRTAIGFCHSNCDARDPRAYAHARARWSATFVNFQTANLANMVAESTNLVKLRRPSRSESVTSVGLACGHPPAGHRQQPFRHAGGMSAMRLLFALLPDCSAIAQLRSAAQVAKAKRIAQNESQYKTCFWGQTTTCCGQLQRSERR